MNSKIKSDADSDADKPASDVPAVLQITTVRDDGLPWKLSGAAYLELPDGLDIFDVVRKAADAMNLESRRPGQWEAMRMRAGDPLGVASAIMGYDPRIKYAVRQYPRSVKRLLTICRRYAGDPTEPAWELSDGKMTARVYPCAVRPDEGEIRVTYGDKAVSVSSDYGRSKYVRKVWGQDGKSFVYADAYDMMEACGVTSPPLSHCIKKLLYAGLRGKGDRMNDLMEARVALDRAIDLERRGSGDGENTANRD